MLHSCVFIMPTVGFVLPDYTSVNSQETQVGREQREGQNTVGFFLVRALFYIQA
jgi:hypothetical protein